MKTWAAKGNPQKFLYKDFHSVAMLLKRVKIDGSIKMVKLEMYKRPPMVTTLGTKTPITF